MKMTIVLDSDDREGIEAATKVVEIMRARVRLEPPNGKKITRLKLIRIIQDYAKLIAFEGGHKDFKEVDYTRLRSVKEFVDHQWQSLD